MYTNKKRSENDQYNETSNHIQINGAAAAGLGPRGRGGTPPRRRRTLSFVYGLMSHCIDRFHFVFYFYTFHFMLPMCIRLIFFGLGHPRWACGSKKIMIFRIGSSKVGLRRQKIKFF